jgi:hypothetical protein
MQPKIVFSKIVFSKVVGDLLSWFFGAGQGSVTLLWMTCR